MRTWFGIIFIFGCVVMGSCSADAAGIAARRQQMIQRQRQQVIAQQQAIRQKMMAQVKAKYVQQQQAILAKKEAIRQKQIQQYKQQMARQVAQKKAQMVVKQVAQKKAQMVVQEVVKKKTQMATQQVIQTRQRQVTQQVVTKTIAQKVSQQRAIQKRKAVKRAMQYSAYRQAAQQKKAVKRRVAREVFTRKMHQKKELQKALVSRKYVKEKYIAQEKIRRMNSGDVGDVEETVDLGEIWDQMETSSEVWNKIIEVKPKMLTVTRYIEYYRRQGIKIRKPQKYYVEMIDSMSKQNPDFLAQPFEDILRFVAIVDYDFDNGHDSDLMARQLLGEKMYWKNKERFRK